jgi:hypothetical protein
MKDNEAAIENQENIMVLVITMSITVSPYYPNVATYIPDR